MAVALMGIGAGFSGPAGVVSPISPALPVAMSGESDSDRTFTLTTTVTRLMPGVTTTFTVTETSSATACQSAAPTNRTSLTLVIEVQEDPIPRGRSQVLYVAVCSEWLGVAGAQVSGTVTDAAGLERSFSGTSNASGLYSFTWDIDPLVAPGTVTIAVQVAKAGYTSGWGSKTFTVTDVA
jgi:phosphatidate phosphatase APP1